MISVTKNTFCLKKILAGNSFSRVSSLLSASGCGNVSANASLHSGSNDSSKMHRPPTAKMGKMTDIGSRSLFSPEQDAFRESVRKFFQKEVIPHNKIWQERGYPDKEIWEKAGECGMLGITIPAEHGGIGGSFVDTSIVIDETGYANTSGSAFFLHSDIIMPYFSKYGNEEQRKKYIPGMTAGKIVSAIAMTEPDAGSDLQGIKTFARKDGSDYILNGSKMFITSGWLADVFIVVAVTNKEAKSAAHGISLFIVDADTPGFKKSWLMKKIGNGASDTAGLFFEDVRLPASALLGQENKGFYYLMNELPQERLTIGIHATAHSEYMFEETKQYVMQRKAYGKTLSNLQTVQHKLAEMKMDICVVRSFIDECIALHVENQLDSQMACMAKICASDLVNKITYQCLQLHGGAGYLSDTPVARTFLDARVQTIYGGSNEVLKDLIARQILAPARK
ncbi:long-chain specific acyl-CoA dehydrogenase, mitochondrial-like [Daphnia carinata]|uniref:long-chain specific acyl-CoA dehydrogenase, mitochondrial-like n=1 Tax=Daphnia carinata TaxID=120202 RepID=UPI00257D0F74|nr:long-chain specific acyl-CoA dehydrogenase, mitochondrial-like [Daphnia carinata]XP_057375246.1 long-chain specific acyl-CoA dehydrogenase, mitochondrial-like [Daphnia carinata]XP_059351427.1 long-chain specific acyl-CoA dehydrogenase, mitochondrial-like [Daphnia carinata]